MTSYYPLRRNPDAYSARYFWRRAFPHVAGVVADGARALAADLLPVGKQGRKVMQDWAREKANVTSENAQKKFFDNPGLDTLAVRELTKVGLGIANAGRAYLWLRISLGMDHDGRSRSAMSLIPKKGYDQLMLTGLAVGTALGLFRGGTVHSAIWWDSNKGYLPIPSGHPLPQARRFEPPKTLSDAAADIDDLYWAEAFGQAIKITRVGEGEARRWIVSVPGTDHPTWESTPNVADFESNFREELNLPSAMRLGLVQAINYAMRTNGIPRDRRAEEKVLLVGHSQGGMVAVALAATDPAKIGFKVAGVITMGSPARRIKVSSDVPVLALEHDQDMVPSLDGTPRKTADGRAVYYRKLVRPRLSPLFYAHASSTYTETLRHAEKRRGVAPWGRVSETLARLRDFLPKPGENTRVLHAYIWQDLLTPTKGNTWDQYLSIERADWEPVSFGGEIEASAKAPLTPAELMKSVLNRGRGGHE